MRSIRPSSTFIVALALTAAACSKKNEPDSFVRAGLSAANGQPQALWAALPPSYQTEVKTLLASAATKMKPEVYDEGFVLLQKATKVLETKKSFVLAHPAMKELPLPPDALSGLDPAVRTLSRLAHSDLATVKGLGAMDVEKFLSGPVAASFEDLMSIGETAASAAPKQAPKLGELRAKLKSAKITVLSTEGNTAKVQIEAEGEETETLEMVKIEERWIPKDLADAWPKVMADARASINELVIPPEAVVQFNAMKGVVGPVLDALLAAKTQDEFNAQVDAAMKGLVGPMLAQRPGDDEANEADEAEADEADEAEAEEMPAKRARSGKSNRRKNRR